MKNNRIGHCERRPFLYVLVVSLFTMTAFLLPACSKRSPVSGPLSSDAGKTMYHCPMHPQYHSDKPGNCPICQMQLVPDAVPAPAAKEHKILYYRSPMNPAMTSPTPTKDSMGMDYVPVYADEVPGAAPVSGQAVVQTTEGERQLVGVKVALVEMRDLFVTVRASARVAYDPGLYSAILEHQAAVDALKNIPASSALHSESAATVRASALRLRQMGLSEDQIANVNEPGFDPSNLLVGKAGGTLWVYAQIYDYEAGLVRRGQEADLTSSAFPGRTFHGTVRAMDPIVNAETRTLKARIETPNPDGALKPDMYLDAAIHAGLGRKLAVPESAVMDTGTRQLVFVENAPGQFVPREVKIGHQASGYFEVLKGLQEGEKVSTAANFLIDSESKIRAAAQAP